MGVKIELANGQLGATVQTDDGVVGMVLSGGIDDGGYALGTPVLIKRYEDLADNGITASGNGFALKQVHEFYNEAGDGASLYLMLVANTLTVADMADKNNANGAKKLLDYAAGDIKVLGIMSNDAQVAVPTTTDGLNNDVKTAIANMTILADHYFDLEIPFRAVIGGTSYQGVPASLHNITNGATDNRVAVLIGDTVAINADNAGAALGLLLGRVSRISVEEKISYVGRGSLAGVTAAFIGADTLESKPYDWSTIDSKGYITLKTYPHKSGYFFSSDRMACGSTDDYFFLCRGRVIDKGHIIAYALFVDDVDGKVPTKDGKIDEGFALSLQGTIEQAIGTAMVGTGEITAVTCRVPLDQDIQATSELAVNLGLTPYGYSSQINVTLGFKK